MLFQIETDTNQIFYNLTMKDFLHFLLFVKYCFWFQVKYSNSLIRKQHIWLWKEIVERKKIKSNYTSQRTKDNNIKNKRRKLQYFSAKQMVKRSGTSSRSKIYQISEILSAFRYTWTKNYKKLKLVRLRCPALGASTKNRLNVIADAAWG